jgi:tRNA A-37 threonylcarbamoyl transferase component Bud32
MSRAEAIIADWEAQLVLERNDSLRFYWQWRQLWFDCDDATCGRVLFELIALQMEFAWKKESKSAPERFANVFIQEFSDYLDEQQNVLLLAEEFRLRWRFGDKPSRQQFLRLYSGGGQELATAIARVESELQREFGWQAIAETAAAPASLSGAGAPLTSSDFLVHRFIGAGSMGRVYVAWQHSLQRHVALKFLRKHFVRNHAAVERFLQEGRLAASLRHPGIIVIHGLGRTPAGNYFIVMDLIDAPALDPIDPTNKDELLTTLDAIAQAAEAMAVAHAAGVIHCDLKPANILCDEQRRVVLTDFGLARRLNDEEIAWPRGEGTPAWIAPEQIDACWGGIGPATDVFNLVATLFWLLTGRSPHAGETADAILASAVSGRPVPLLSELVPAALVELCAAGLVKNPRQRLSSMAELAKCLRAIAAST